MISKFANVVKGISADAVEKANSGHPGLPIGCAEIGSVLFTKIMKYNPAEPEWPNRDRFVLSAGHGSMLLYSLLYLSGYDLSLEDLKNFRQINSKTPGHPEYGHTAGVDTTTGPLGQGFANAVGMAVSERILAEKYNTEEHKIIDYNIYTLMGDGCMMEGIVSEAASYAGHLGLGKLIAVYDNNQISIGGSTDITFTEDVGARFRAYNWHVIEDVDGHDVQSVEAALKEANKINDKPTLIIANTKIACGAPTKEGKCSAHGAPLGKEEVKGLKENIGLPSNEKFYVPDEIKEYTKKLEKQLNANYKRWEAEFADWADTNPELKKGWDKANNLELPSNLKDIFAELENNKPEATRNSSGEFLKKAAASIDYLVGGSADLAPSNKTYLDDYGEIQSNNFKGRNFRFGVREHAMAAIANGISVNRGLRPFISTFLVFSDYMKPSVRMAALMKQPIIYIFTHDSIYVGEDGPTHQPVEHIEALRIIPNLQVIRPADLEESRSAWTQALEKTDGPTALILSRQALPQLNKNKIENIDRGGYLVSGTVDADISLIASGSEVSLAVETAKILKEQNIGTKVVSVLNRDKFMTQPEIYIDELISIDNKLNILIEAGVSSGWYQLLGKNCLVFSVEDFGISGPGKEVAKKLNLSADHIAEKIMQKI